MRGWRRSGAVPRGDRGPRPRARAGSPSPRGDAAEQHVAHGRHGRGPGVCDAFTALRGAVVGGKDGGQFALPCQDVVPHIHLRVPGARVLEADQFPSLALRQGSVRRHPAVTSSAACVASWVSASFVVSVMIPTLTYFRLIDDNRGRGSSSAAFGAIGQGVRTGNGGRTDRPKWITGTPQPAPPVTAPAPAMTGA